MRTPESEAQTPESEVCTPDGGTRSPDSGTNTPEDNTGREMRTKEGKTTPRALRVLETRSKTLGKEEKDDRSGEGRHEEQQRGGNDAERKIDPALLKTMRRLSI